MQNQKMQYTLVIEHDLDPENPRDWDNIGTFVSFDPNSAGADESSNDLDQYLIGLIEQYDNGFEQRLIDKDVCVPVSELLEIVEKYYVILPVFKYEHSGVAYNTSGFSCQWDSGQVGFIYVSNEKLRKEYGWKRITAARVKKACKIMAGEIDTFSLWANGNVYGFQLHRHDFEEPHTSAEEQDSCWGFYHDCAPETLEELRECGIADHLPDECLNDDLVILFKD